MTEETLFHEVLDKPPADVPPFWTRPVPASPNSGPPSMHSWPRTRRQKGS